MSTQTDRRPAPLGNDDVVELLDENCTMIAATLRQGNTAVFVAFREEAMATYYRCGGFLGRVNCPARVYPGDRVELTLPRGAVQP